MRRILRHVRRFLKHVVRDLTRRWAKGPANFWPALWRAGGSSRAGTQPKRLLLKFPDQTKPNPNHPNIQGHLRGGFLKSRSFLARSGPGGSRASVGPSRPGSLFEWTAPPGWRDPPRRRWSLVAFTQPPDLNLRTSWRFGGSNYEPPSAHATSNGKFLSPDGILWMGNGGSEVRITNLRWPGQVSLSGTDTLHQDESSWLVMGGLAWFRFGLGA